MYKAIFRFSSGGFGPTETIHINTASMLLAAYYGNIYLSKRAEMLPTFCTIREMSVVNLGTREMRTYPAGHVHWDSTVQPGQGKYTGNIQWDQVRVALRMEQRVGVTRRGYRYVWLIPDSISGDDTGESYKPSGDPTWVAALNGWRTELIKPDNPFRIQVRPSTPTNIAITGYVRMAGTSSVCGITAYGTDDITVSSSIQISGAKVSSGGTKVNGVWKVLDYTDPSESGLYTIWLEDTENWTPDLVRTKGVFHRVADTFQPLSELNPVRVGIRQRGKGSFGPRGRAPTRR